MPEVLSASPFRLAHSSGAPDPSGTFWVLAQAVAVVLLSALKPEAFLFEIGKVRV